MCFVSKGTFTGKSPYSAASYIRMMLMDSWVHDCYGVFRGVVLSLLIDAWAADWDDGQLMTSLLIQDDPLHWQPSWYSIPEDILPNMQPAHPASMLCYLSDPEVYDWDKAFYLRFVWPRQWPRYDGDVDVYVRQPYSRKPALDYVDILALKDPDPPSSNRKLIVVASSPEVLERVVTSQYLSRMPSTRAPDVYAQILRFFCNLCNLILEDMLVFKAGVERSVEAIVSQLISWLTYLLTETINIRIDVEGKVRQASKFSIYCTWKSASQVQSIKFNAITPFWIALKQVGLNDRARLSRSWVLIFKICRPSKATLLFSSMS